MARILILVPMKPNISGAIRSRQLWCLSRLKRANPEHVLEVRVDSRGPGDAGITELGPRVEHTAPIRQAMLDDYLRPEHDAVLWIDADVIQYPADLPAQLWARGEAGQHVTAPMVVTEDQQGRYYDLAGFVEAGRWCRLMSPWFDQPGPAYELDGVGCVYMVPAAVYRAGAKHRLYPGFTDHLHICEAARAQGRKVLAFGDLVATHAWLPKYGEDAH